MNNMRWFPFAILAAIAIICQAACAQVMAIHQIWPNLMLVLAVHYALWGRWPDVAIAAWILGLLVDLHTLDRIGLHAFCFGAVAWAIVRVRQVLFRDHPMTHVVVTLVFAFAVQWLVGFYEWWCDSDAVSLGGMLWPAFFTALYTAACAPYLHWPLIRMGRWTGLQSPRNYLVSR